MNQHLIPQWLCTSLAALIITVLSASAPLQDGTAIAANLDAASSQTSDISATSYVIRAGDTLANIALRNNTTIRTLLQINPQITNPNQIFIGQRISVPTNYERVRIQFAEGATSATQEGTVGLNETIIYVFDAQQGQNMAATLDAPDGNIAWSIIDSAGVLLDTTNEVFEWSGTLPTTGEYRIEVVSILGAFDKRYTLTTSIAGSDIGVDEPADPPADPPVDNPIGSTVSHTFTPQGGIDFSVRTDGDVSILDLVDPTSGQVRQGFVVTPETAALLSESYGLIVEDMNYDGYDDFRLVEFLTAGANIPYQYYLYDPSTTQFVYNSELRGITSPEFVGSNTILSRWQLGGANWGIDIYAYVTGKPTLLVKQEWNASNNGEITHTVTVFEPEATTGSNDGCTPIAGPAQPDGTTDDRVECTRENLGPDGPNMSGGGPAGPVAPIGPTEP